MFFLEYVDVGETYLILVDIFSTEAHQNIWTMSIKTLIALFRTRCYFSKRLISFWLARPVGYCRQPWWIEGLVGFRLWSDAVQVVEALLVCVTLQVRGEVEGRAMAMLTYKVELAAIYFWDLLGNVETKANILSAWQFKSVLIQLAR